MSFSLFSSNYKKFWWLRSQSISHGYPIILKYNLCSWIRSYLPPKNIGGSKKRLWSLIPYIYYPWLQSPKNCANNYSELYLTKKISDASFRYIFLEDWSQSEKKSEIKPPLGWHSLSIIELPRDPHHIFPCMFQGHRKW